MGVQSNLIANIPTDNLRLLVTGTAAVTRAASTDTQVSLIDTGTLGANIFMCFVYYPNSSPNLILSTPHISYNVNTGVIWERIRASYDPDTGYIRLYNECTLVNPLYASDQTWNYRYYVFGERSK